MNNIILLEKENVFNHMGEHIKTGHLGCELLDMTRWGGGGVTEILQGIELYLGFWSGRFLFILVVCLGSVLATTQLFECCQQEGKAGVGYLQF
jgi:hypothetical protein